MKILANDLRRYRKPTTGSTLVVVDTRGQRPEVPSEHRDDCPAFNSPFLALLAKRKGE